MFMAKKVKKKVVFFLLFFIFLAISLLIILFYLQGKNKALDENESISRENNAVYGQTSAETPFIEDDSNASSENHEAGSFEGILKFSDDNNVDLNSDIFRLYEDGNDSNKKYLAYFRKIIRLQIEERRKHDNSLSEEAIARTGFPISFAYEYWQGVFQNGNVNKNIKYIVFTSLPLFKASGTDILSHKKDFDGTALIQFLSFPERKIKITPLLSTNNDISYLFENILEERKLNDIEELVVIGDNSISNDSFKGFIDGILASTNNIITRDTLDTFETTRIEFTFWRGKIDGYLSSTESENKFYLDFKQAVVDSAIPKVNKSTAHGVMKLNNPSNPLDVTLTT